MYFLLLGATTAVNLILSVYRAAMMAAGHQHWTNHFVIAGSDPGSKVDKAEKLGVPVLDEADFQKMLQTPEAYI